MTVRFQALAPWGQTTFALVFLASLTVGLMFPAIMQPSALLAGADVHLHASWEAVNRLAYDAGQSPYWNPYSFGGYPGMADIQTLAYYPPAMLLRGLPVSAFLTWGIVLHLWLLAVGVFVLSRQLGTGRVAGLVAATGVMLSGAVVPKIYAGHLIVLFGYAWVPLALALSIRWSRRMTLWPDPALVAVLVLQVLAGFLQGTVYLASVVAAVFVWRALHLSAAGLRTSTLLAQPVVLVGLVGALLAFQLLPTSVLVGEAGRTAGVDYAFASENPFTPGDFAAAVFPNTRGLRDNRWDSSLFITLGLLVFAPLAWCHVGRRRHASLLLLMAGVALGLAMADTLPLFRLHHALLPYFRAPTRLLFFWTIGAAVLGGLGLDVLLRRASRREDPSVPAVPWHPWVPAAVGGVLLLSVFVTAPTNRESALLGTPGWLITLQVVALPVLGALVVRRQAVLTGAVALLVVATEGLVFARPMVQVRDNASRNSVLEQLASHDAVRVTSLCEHSLSPAELVSIGIPTTDGLGSISLGSYARFLALVKNDELGGHVTRLGQDSQRLPARLDLLDFLAVSHVVTCEPIEHDRFRFIEPLGSMYLYRNLNARPRTGLTCIGETYDLETVMRMLASNVYNGEGRLVSRIPRVTVRWALETSDNDRGAVERRFGLSAGYVLEGRNWRYELVDARPDNIVGLLSDPLVEDTAGIDRATARLLPSDVVANPQTSGGDELSLLVDAAACDGVQGSAAVHEVDRPDGSILVTVQNAEPALLYLSEPYYPERRVWVNGEERPVERVNAAFSGVRLEPGNHVVEMKFVPTSLYWGSSISVLVGVLWICAVCVVRVHRYRTWSRS